MKVRNGAPMRVSLVPAQARAATHPGHARLHGERAIVEAWRV